MFNVVGSVRSPCSCWCAWCCSGPSSCQRWPARQAASSARRARLWTQDALDQLKQEAELKDLDLPDLRVGSLRQQARGYVRELLDIEGQMAELEWERDRLRAAFNPDHDQIQDGPLEPEQEPAPARVDREAT